jgi:hypothetical protein
MNKHIFIDHHPFDKAYVFLINAMGDSRAGKTGCDVGAPFTTQLAISLEI